MGERKMSQTIPVKTIDEVLTQWRSPPKRVLFVVREESDLKFNVVDAWRNYICKKFGSSFGSVSDLPKGHIIHQYLEAPGWYMDNPSSEAFFSKEAREKVRVEYLLRYLNLSAGVAGLDYDRVIAYRTLYEQLEEKLSSSGVSVVRSDLTGFFKSTEILKYTHPTNSVWESNDPTPLENVLFGATTRASVRDYIFRKFQEKFDTALYLGGGCFCCSAIRNDEGTLVLSQIFGNRFIVASPSKNFEGHRKDGVDDGDFGRYLGISDGTYVAPTLIGI
ncbi:hypothetical protein HZC31_08055 [Candidatus Woesearchaeota archaeon]|nr:hypothetical protein [Candidatus Woesearchaeota archaeon]